MDKRPNIILITMDQLRYDYIGAYQKDKFVKTPNLDKLAEEGCVYENAYSPNPVCIPARHNIITGLTAKYHGFDDNYFGKDAKSCPWSLPTFATLLSDAGYRTIAIGKIHFQPERRSTGFDYFLNADEVVYDVNDDDYARELSENGYEYIGSYHGVRNALYMQPQESLLPKEWHGSYWTSSKCIEYINRSKNENRPFMMWCGFKDPHPPFDLPSEWSHVNDGNIPQHFSSITPLSKLAEENKCIADLPNEESINRMREQYANAISFVDYNIGRIVDALKENQLYENTVLFITSDHGEMLGDLDTYQKFLPYDASCRIPFIVHYPNVVKPERKQEFVDLNDLYPTFLDLANATYTGIYKLPGESLFTKTKEKDRTVQYVEHQRNNKRWCMLRNKEYKYVHYYGDNDELYDMIHDPEEKVNLLYEHQDEYKEIVQELKEKLISYEKEWGLEGYIINDTFKEFPPYEIKHYRETCFPYFAHRISNETVMPLEQEILEAIKNEPVVKLSKLHIKELLINEGKMTEEAWNRLVEEAKRIDRW